MNETDLRVWRITHTIPVPGNGYDVSPHVAVNSPTFVGFPRHNLSPNVANSDGIHARGPRSASSEQRAFFHSFCGVWLLLLLLA